MWPGPWIDTPLLVPPFGLHPIAAIWAEEFVGRCVLSTIEPAHIFQLEASRESSAFGELLIVRVEYPGIRTRFAPLIRGNSTTTLLLVKHRFSRGTQDGYQLESGINLLEAPHQQGWQGLQPRPSRSVQLRDSFRCVSRPASTHGKKPKEPPL